jgi:hypothetical protein
MVAVLLPGLVADTAGANERPGTVTGLSVSSNGSDITFQWNPGSDPDGNIVGYNVYVGGNYTTTVSNTSYTESIAGRSGTLEYQVTSFDDGDPREFSSMSEVAAISLDEAPVRDTDPDPDPDPEPEPQAPTGPNQRPTPPSSVSVSSDGTSLEVTWTGASDPEGDIDGYNIYRNGGYEDTVGADASSWSEPIGNLTGNVEYSVVTFDGADPTEYSTTSDVASIFLTDEPEPVRPVTDDNGDDPEGDDGPSGSTPDSPEGISGARDFRADQVSRDAVVLRWNRPESVNFPGIITGYLGYNIYRDNTYIDTISPTSSFARSYTDDISQLDGNHTYYVTAFVETTAGTKHGVKSTEIDVRIPLPEDQPVVDPVACPDGVSNRLMIAGDSWADRVGPFLDSTFRARGWTVHKLGVGSTTSRDWLPGTVDFLDIEALLGPEYSDECSNNVVSFSVGGNDLVLPNAGAAAFPQTVEQVQQRLAVAARNISTSIAAMRAIDPDVKIVLPGYDLLNPNVNAACLTAAAVISGTPGEPFDPRVSNQRVLALRQMFVSVADAWDNVSAPNLIGSIQDRPGNPDLSALPPVVYMANDCIHLTDGTGEGEAEPFGYNGYEIWGSELAMVIDPTLSLTYRVDLSPDPPPPSYDDPFGDPLPDDGEPLGEDIVFEAEDFTERDSTGWTDGVPSSGAVGEAVVTLAGPSTDRDSGARITYEIPVAVSAAYNLWVRRRSITNATDSFTWGIDGGQQRGEGDGGYVGSSFTWVYVGTADLQAGTRVLDIGRIDGTMVLDRIALLSRGELPSGEGPPANLVPRRAASADDDTINSLTIDYQQLFVQDAGEEGGFQNGDEPRLVVIEFRVTPGVPGSTEVINSFRYDGPSGRDDGDTWIIPDRIGQFTYSGITAVDVDDIRSGSLPELIGHVAILLEDDVGSSSPVRDKIDDVAAVLRTQIAEILEPLSPVTLASDPAGLAAEITVASGLVVDAAQPDNVTGVQDDLEEAVLDIFGADVVGFFPIFFLAVDDNLAPYIDNAFAEQLQGVPAAGGAMRDRSFQFSKRGSGATYVVDVEVTIGR